MEQKDDKVGRKAVRGIGRGGGAEREQSRKESCQREEEVKQGDDRVGKKAVSRDRRRRR